jgi:hypothetical protein
LSTRTVALRVFVIVQVFAWPIAMVPAQSADRPLT